MKKVLLYAFSLLMAMGSLPVAALAAEVSEVAPGSLIKSESSSAVYYVDEDLSRHVFPNGRIFLSWFASFDGVIELTDSQIAEFPLAGNVPYKPGKIMVKIQSDPKVYAVDEGGILRWVKNENVARALYGPNWNRLIQDLSDAFFVDYQVGTEIEAEADFDEEQGTRVSKLLETLREKRLKRLASRGASAEALENRGFGRNKVAVCHSFGTDGAHTIFIARPALKAHLGHGDTEGRCAGDQDGSADVTAPTFTSFMIGSVGQTSAHVLITASEAVMAKVYSSTSTPVDVSASATPAAVASALNTSHDITLTGLSPGTTHHVRVVVTDAAGNTTASSTLSFATLVQDTDAPAFLSATTTDILATSARVIFTADENVTAEIFSGTSTPVTTTGTPIATSITLSTSHDVTLTGLAPETIYYVRIVAKDAAGNETVSSELSFTTAAL